jgi:hypothetical protein
MSWPNYPGCSLMRTSLDGRASTGGTLQTNSEAAIVAREQDLAMIGTKLNAQVTISDHQEPPEHAREVTSAHGPGSARENGAHRNIRTGPACKAGDHTRADPKTA